LIGPRCTGGEWSDAGRVFAYVDGSGHSEAVLPIAAAWAGSLDLSLCVLHVVARPDLAASGLPRGDVLECNYVAALINSLRRGGVHADWEVLRGRATGRTIVAHAASNAATLIALSSHSRPDRRGPLGRVALEVVAASPVPVLIARSHGLWRAVMSLAEPSRPAAAGF
jgi:nucleotide-binding universal stress UspA family protein